MRGLSGGSEGLFTGRFAEGYSNTAKGSTWVRTILSNREWGFVGSFIRFLFDMLASYVAFIANFCLCTHRKVGYENQHSPTGKARSLLLLAPRKLLVRSMSSLRYQL